MEGGLCKPTAEMRQGGTFLPYPFTVAMGDSEEMRKAIQLLDEVKESIINAYQIKTGLSRIKLSHLMDSETWMNALKAKELGFCDEVLYTEDDLSDDASGFSFARKTAAISLMNRVMAKVPRNGAEQEYPAEGRVDASGYDARLNVLKYL